MLKMTEIYFITFLPFYYSFFVKLLFGPLLSFIKPFTYRKKDKIESVLEGWSCNKLFSFSD